MEYLANVVGLSGSGKSTAIMGAQALLRSEGISTNSFHDRTADAQSRKLDSLLHTADLSPMARMYLIIAARRQVIDRQILPSLRTNDVTITDRYYQCTVAYQAYGEGLDLALVSQTAIRAAEDALPDRVFLLDIPAETALQRMKDRGGQEQVFDAEQQAFHERVRQGYLDLAAGDERFSVIDGLAPRHEIARFIADSISRDIRNPQVE